MIHRIRIQNFKSIVDVTVDLSPVTVLVGKSGTGKSNFVQAIRFLRDVLSHDPRRLQPIWPQIRPAIPSTEPTRFEINFSVEGIEQQFGYVLSLPKEGIEFQLLEEQLSLGDKCLFRQALKPKKVDPRTGQPAQQLAWISPPELVQVPPPGQIALGRIPSIFEIGIAFTALTLGIGCYSFSDKVLRGEAQNQTAPAASTPGLDDEATNFLEALKGIVNNLQDLKPRKTMVAVLNRINPSVSSVDLNDIQRPAYIVVGHKINGKMLPLQLSQESDGFRRFYAHLLALYQQPPKQTLIFEHPEDGFHPGALGLLADEFKTAPENGRGQVILTTHSPKLLDHFDGEQIRVVELDGFETRIGLVSNEQKEAIHDKLLDAGELLTVDPVRMQKEPAGA